MAETEGPFWDYVARSEYLERRREHHALNCAEYLLRGDVEWATRFAVMVQEVDQDLAAVQRRYRATRETPARWVGWHAL